MDIKGGQGARPWCSTSGAIYSTTAPYNVFLQPQDSPSGVETSETVHLNVNGGKSSLNPMFNHANGDDIHPYSIKILYLIAY